jgi:hypothetical protein
MLTRMFVVVAILACNSNAVSLQSSSSPLDPLDLEVVTLDSQGNATNAVYYSFDQLLTLPLVNVRTERDPNTNAPATYTGVYISDLFEAFGADKSIDAIGAKCSDGRKQYCDPDYVAKHRPILLLKFDGNVPRDGHMGSREISLDPTASFMSLSALRKQSTATSNNQGDPRMESSHLS